jgi:hypothetical protein
MMTTYFDTDYKTIQYDSNHHILIGTWKLPPTSAEYRTGMMAMIDAMEKFKTGRLVYDAINLGIILQEDQQWSAKEWRSLAVAVGHSKVSFLLSEDIFSKMSTEDMMSEADNDVSYAYFNRMQDAIRWVVLPQQKNGVEIKGFKSITDK